MTPGPDPRGPVLAVCGLAAEARIAAGEGVVTIAGGGRSIALAAAIEREIRNGVSAVVSFGIAGALVPSLRPGALVVARRVVAPDATYPVDAAWMAAMLRRLPVAIAATMAGVDTLVGGRAAKGALGLITGADTVDMESHVAARLSLRYGLPFAALRAVTDPVDRSLPPAASIALRPDGTVDAMAVLGSIVLYPKQLPRLVRSGLDTRRALSALGDGRRALGRSLGHLDLDQLAVDVV